MYAAIRDASTAMIKIAAAKRGPLKSYVEDCERLMNFANNCDPRIPESVVVRQVIFDLLPTSRDIIKQVRQETVPELMVRILTFGPQLLFKQRASSGPTNEYNRSAPITQPSHARVSTLSLDPILPRRSLR